MKLFIDTNTIDLATGPGGSGPKNADNLAIDADGNMYVIEDRNGGSDNDVWFARDPNKDGDLLDAGEGIGRWVSNGTQGSETTGLLQPGLTRTRPTSTSSTPAAATTA